MTQVTSLALRKRAKAAVHRLLPVGSAMGEPCFIFYPT